MLKISPDMPDEVIDRVTDILLETPLDGIVATNGTHLREGLRTSRTSLDKIGTGRLGGAPLTRRAVEIVRRVHARSGGNYPIIGVGGLMTPDDVRAMLDAGADLVQLYTGYIYEGPGLVGEICRALIDDARQPQGNAGQPQDEAREIPAPTAEPPQAEEQHPETDPTVSPETDGGNPPAAPEAAAEQS